MNEVTERNGGVGCLVARTLGMVGTLGVWLCV